MEINLILFAFGLTVLVGLCSGIGGLILLIYRDINTKLLSVVLGFSAGIMLYISFLEILPEASEYIRAMGQKNASLVTAAIFIGSILVMFLIDSIIPSCQCNGHNHPLKDKNHRNKRLLRTGILTAFALIIHNFPEGLAMFTTIIQKPSIGISIAVALAIHNIIAGISVATPIYYASRNRGKAISIALLCGLSIPVGGVGGYLILAPFLNDLLYGLLYAMIGGIMVFISLHELLPASREYGNNRLSMLGLMMGMAVMAVCMIFI